ncbi:hypothetical protein [Acidovorax sp.]|uniref:hypothetical protein n=1 Tax=Acidovorax sp. TaxID=1872122 RepID=UPI00391EEF57
MHRCLHASPQQCGKIAILDGAVRPIYVSHPGVEVIGQDVLGLSDLISDGRLQLRVGTCALALVLQQQTGRQVLNEASLGRKVLYLQPKALHGEESVAPNRTVFDLPQLQGQAGSKALRALQPFASVDGMQDFAREFVDGLTTH